MKEFEEIYRENYSFIYGFLRKLCGNRELAEELSGETFYQAFRSFRKVRGESKVSTWLTAIAKHVYYHYLKSHRLSLDTISLDTVEDVLAGNSLPTAGPEIGLLQEEQRQALRRTLRKLPDKYRDVVLLRIYADLPFAEVAAALKISENSAKVIYCRAKKMLSEELKHEFDL